MKGLTGLLGMQKPRSRRPRLRLDETDIVIYAIGDVHGCFDALLSLERKITDDATTVTGRKLIVMIGDYVDRGPASAQVIDHLIAPPPRGFERICLAGNHEVVMVDYLEGRRSLPEWMSMGAEQTLLSYGVDYARLCTVYRSEKQIDEEIRKMIPVSHIAFLRSLPVLIESSRYLFVHAGIRPGIELDKQIDEDLVFIRSAFYDNAHLLTRYVVHGHTPVDEAKVDGMRINIDTGAASGGHLTALRLWRNKGRYLAS